MYKRQESCQTGGGIGTGVGRNALVDGVLRVTAIGGCAQHLAGRQVVGNTHECRYEVVAVQILVAGDFRIEELLQHFCDGIDIIVIIAVLGAGKCLLTELLIARCV